MSDTVQGTRPIAALNSHFNALSYMMESAIRGQVNTAIPVRVDSVEPGGRGPVGYLSATPLVTQMDGQGKALPQQSLPRLPYMRMQGGKCAVIIDPEPGDIGIAIFAQQDISTIGTGAAAPAQPGSFRAFDMADGMYIGGIINKEPETWVELTQEGEITVHAPAKIRMETPLLELTGRFVQVGGQGEGATMLGGLVNTGGTISSNNIVLETHTHKGVQPGSGNTEEPNG